MSKPSIPKGTRDFSAETVRKRNFILENIKDVFELYGFQPLETPAMENLETLMGKYGEEGDQLLFKILNNGLNDPKNKDKALSGFNKLMDGRSSEDLTERALKYDLTIPFARYVAMNYGSLTFPYKRYQVQPVWRADRPQRGRYREFTQCDADIVGSTALLNELELSNIYHDAFLRLGLREYSLKINSRKILAALANICGGATFLTGITVAIDKLDKIGLEKVKDELVERGLNDEQVKKIETYLSIAGSNEEKLAASETLFANEAAAVSGIKELRYVLEKSSANVVVDLTLARGLNYYTGIIFEAKGPAKVKMGSIGGGGRYDDLTSLFGVPDIAGVGISFGVDRIYDIMDELGLFPSDLEVSTKVLFLNLGSLEADAALENMQQLRKHGISCELYHEASKLDKQFKYAEKKHIPFAVIIGSKELEENNCVVKNLLTVQQQIIPLKHLPGFLSDL